MCCLISAYSNVRKYLDSFFKIVVIINAYSKEKLYDKNKDNKIKYSSNNNDGLNSGEIILNH